MSGTTHQTVRLAKGKHTTPHHGVCVMELASMLAGEPFSDHPRSVCPVIAAFLRAYNDAIDDKRRQDLYRFAAAAVGTRAGTDVEAARAELCAQWTREQQAELRPRLHRVLSRLGPPPPACGVDVPATAAARVAARHVGRNRPHAHDAALEFVDRLIAYAEPCDQTGYDRSPRSGSRLSRIATPQTPHTA